MTQCLAAQRIDIGIVSPSLEAVQYIWKVRGAGDGYARVDHDGMP